MKLRNKRIIKTPKPYLKKECRNYYVRLTAMDGSRREINLGTADKKAARLRARQEVEQINKQLDGTFVTAVDLEAMAVEYYKSMVNLQPSSLLRSKQHLNGFILYIKQHYPEVKYLNQIAGRHIAAFQGDRKNNKSARGGTISPKTVREAVYVVNNLFEWAVKQGYVQDNPVRKIEKLSAPPTDQHVFSDNDLLKLLTHCKANPRYKWLYPAYLTLITTGMRSGELTNLLWSDLDFERRVIKVRTKMLPNGKMWMAKTKQNRELKMDDEVFNVLQGLQGVSTSVWVFTNTKGNRLRGRMVYEHLLSICDVLGIKKGQVHSFRRSFACMMDKAVQDRVAIKETLGHSTMTMTDRYCQYRPKEYIDKAHLKTTSDFIKKLKAVEEMTK